MSIYLSVLYPTLSPHCLDTHSMDVICQFNILSPFISLYLKILSYNCYIIIFTYHLPSNSLSLPLRSLSPSLSLSLPLSLPLSLHLSQSFSFSHSPSLFLSLSSSLSFTLSSSVFLLSLHQKYGRI